MKSKLKIQLSVVLLLGFIVFAATLFETDSVEDEFKYIGVDKCAGVCHKGDSKGNMLEIWQDSKHSQAYKTLQTAAADSIATAKGFTTAAVETPECLKCHVLGKAIVPEELESSFDITQGVQCETCHGPGSEYKKLSIMKDKEKAMANGLIIHTEKEAFCTQCHNSESPNFVSFDYDTMWDKIKHPAPAKE